MLSTIKSLFGFGQKVSGVESLLVKTTEDLIDKTGFDISYEVKTSDKRDNEFLLEFYGEDENLFKRNDGALLDALEIFYNRSVQSQVKDKRSQIHTDCDGFREQSEQNLLDLAEKLKLSALKKNKPVFFKPLPARERKLIHKYLSDDKRIVTRSIGDGNYKKVKISPAREQQQNH